VEATYFMIECSYHVSTGLSTARDDMESLEERIIALSITIEELTIMNRWGQAAKDRRRDGAGRGEM
jgi:hypothetical protein